MRRFTKPKYNLKLQCIKSHAANMLTSMIPNRSVPLYRPTSLSETEHRERHATILVNQIDEYVEKGIIAIDNLQVENDRETLALLTATNSFADDLEIIVFDLTSIAIRTYKNGHSDVEIPKIAKNFSNYTYSIQKSNSADTGILKEELKSCLDDMRDELRQLHELHKTEGLPSSIFNVIENILFAVKKLYYRTIFETKTPQELEEIELKIKSTFVCGTKNINEEDDGNINNLLKHALQAKTKSCLAVCIIEEEVDCYDDKTNLELSQIAYSLSQDLAIVDNAMHTKDEPDAIKDHIAICGRTCCNEMMKLSDLLESKMSNKNLDLRLRNLVLLAVAHHCALGDGIADGVQHLSQN